MVEPLFHERRPLGFAVFDLGEAEGYTCEVLREPLSAALYRLPR